MNNRVKRENGGFVWLIVILVIGVVIGIMWTKRANDAGTNATSTTTTTTDTSEPVSNITPATPAPTPSPTPAKTPAKTPTPSPAPTMTSTGQYIVRYYSTGFSPSKLTIGVGKSVRFTNSAQAAMQINPVDATNAPYSSLRQSKSVGTGGTFDYTFTQRGVYGYYNANNKSHVGIITVQ